MLHNVPPPATTATATAASASAPTPGARLTHSSSSSSSSSPASSPPTSTSASPTASPTITQQHHVARLMASPSVAYPSTSSAPTYTGTVFPSSSPSSASPYMPSSLESSPISHTRTTRDTMNDPLWTTMDVRPRAVSSQQTQLLSVLSSQHLDWHILKASSPNLIFPLFAVGGLDVKSDKTLFCLFFPEAAAAQQQQTELELDAVTGSGLISPIAAAPPKKQFKPVVESEYANEARIDLIEKEAVVKSIPLDQIVQIERSVDEEQTLKLIYMYDPSARGQPKKKGTGNKKPFMLAFSYESVKDSIDVLYMIQYHMKYGFRGLDYGQICIHKGFVDKKRKSGLSWTRRYLRLVNNRLLLYRTPQSPLPVNVFSLSGAVAHSNVIVSQPKKKHFIIDMQKNTAKHKTRKFTGAERNSLLFRVDTQEECDQWVRALELEREVRFGQPLSELLKPPANISPTTVTSTNASIASTTGGISPRSKSTTQTTISASPTSTTTTTTIPHLNFSTATLNFSTLSASPSPTSSTNSSPHHHSPRVALTSDAQALLNSSRSSIMVAGVGPIPIGRKNGKDKEMSRTMPSSAFATALKQHAQALQTSPPLKSQAHSTSPIPTALLDSDRKSGKMSPQSSPHHHSQNSPHSQVSPMLSAASSCTSPKPPLVPNGKNSINMSPMMTGKDPAISPSTSQRSLRDNNNLSGTTRGDTEELRRIIKRLVEMSTNQKLFFEHFTHFRNLHVLWRSQLYSVTDWMKLTPHKIYRSRGKVMQRIDEALDSYHKSITISNTILMHAKLVCMEQDTQAATSQIGFAFPGFDSHVFDIGRMGVVSIWRFFSETSPLAFQQHDWNGALSSRCCAKELMQSSPDVSFLFDQNRADEAKHLMRDAQLDVLHNICLASYTKTIGAKLRVAHGEVIPWTAVLSQFDREARERNRVHLDAWTPMLYIYNPDVNRIQQLIAQHAQALGGTTTQTTTTTATSLNVPDKPVMVGMGTSPNPSPASTSQSHKRGKSHFNFQFKSNSRPNSKPSSRQPSPERSVDDTTISPTQHTRHATVAYMDSEKWKRVKAAVDDEDESEDDHTPRGTRTTAQSTATRPTSSSISATPSRHGKEYRLLLDPLHLFLTLRYLMDERRAKLHKLIAYIDQWLDKYAEGREKSRNKRFAQVQLIKDRVIPEKRDLDILLAHLPPLSALDAALKAHTRLQSIFTINTLIGSGKRKGIGIHTAPAAFPIPTTNATTTSQPAAASPTLPSIPTPAATATAAAASASSPTSNGTPTFPRIPSTPQSRASESVTSGTPASYETVTRIQYLRSSSADLLTPRVSSAPSTPVLTSATATATPIPAPAPASANLTRSASEKVKPRSASEEAATPTTIPSLPISTSTDTIPTLPRVTSAPGQHSTSASPRDEDDENAVVITAEDISAAMDGLSTEEHIDLLVRETLDAHASDLRQHASTPEPSETSELLYLSDDDGDDGAFDDHENVDESLTDTTGKGISPRVTFAADKK